MSEKRRDNKNRVLRNGESQRLGERYAYKYIDANGKQQFVYRWKLEKTDRLPKGKRDDLSLREKEKFLLLFRARICQDKPRYAEKPDEPEKLLKTLKRPKIKKNHDKPTYARSLK